MKGVVFQLVLRSLVLKKQHHFFRVVCLKGLLQLEGQLNRSGCSCVKLSAVVSEEELEQLNVLLHCIMHLLSWNGGVNRNI